MFSLEPWHWECSDELFKTISSRRILKKKVFCLTWGENAVHDVAWKCDLQMLKCQKQKKKKKTQRIWTFYALFFPSFNIVSFSHSAVGGRKGEKNGSQSWFRSICICNSSSQGKWDGCSPGLESLMAGQKDIPKHMDYTQIKNNYDFSPPKNIYWFVFFFPFQKVGLISGVWFVLFCLVLFE